MSGENGLIRWRNVGRAGAEPPIAGARVSRRYCAPRQTPPIYNTPWRQGCRRYYCWACKPLLGGTRVYGLASAKASPLGFVAVKGAPLPGRFRRCGCTICSSSNTKILPSPIFAGVGGFLDGFQHLVEQFILMATSIFTLGRKSTTYSAPRYSSRCGLLTTKAFDFGDGHPCTPIVDRASRTSSSLNGLMTADTSFIQAP